jgi:Esterase/lipase
VTAPAGTSPPATALLARDRDGPEIAYQLLVYPVTGAAPETESYDENAEGYFLTADLVDWYRSLYFEDSVDEGNIYARPRLCQDLSGLPPATVLTAGFDPLRDDGAAYARRLDADGVPVSYHNYPGLIHGFLNMIAEPISLAGATTAYAQLSTDLTDELSAETRR